MSFDRNDCDFRRRRVGGCIRIGKKEKPPFILSLQPVFIDMRLVQLIAVSNIGSLGFFISDQTQINLYYK